MARKSRLSKSFQKRNRNTFLISILGIFIILFLLIKYGIPLISDASFLFGKVTSSPESTDGIANEDVFVPTPRLYSLPSTTGEEIITVEGSALSGLTIEIYLNGEKAGKTETDASGEFQYEVTLTQGDNIIKARALNKEFESEFSNSRMVKFSNTGPPLLIESPSNESDKKGGNPIEVKGTTNPDSTVTVNGFQAIINSEGKWSYRLNLVDGGNDILVTSIDPAGNKTEETIRVNYSQ